MAAHYYKDRDHRHQQIYVLVLDDERVGEVRTRKEAQKWWEREERKEVLQVRAMSRAVRGRHYAAIQEFGPGRIIEG